MLKRNSVVKIHSYKHDKSIHRVWNNVTVLDFNEEMLVVGNYKARVVESNGRYWNTKEPAICFFYTNEWFNVIAMMKEVIGGLGLALEKTEESAGDSDE